MLASCSCKGLRTDVEPFGVTTSSMLLCTPGVAWRIGVAVRCRFVPLVVVLKVWAGFLADSFWKHKSPAPASDSSDRFSFLLLTPVKVLLLILGIGSGVAPSAEKSFGVKSSKALLFGLTDLLCGVLSGALGRKASQTLSNAPVLFMFSNLRSELSTDIWSETFRLQLPWPPELA